MKYAVLVGSYHKYLPSKIVHLADSYSEAREWIRAHIKVGQHMYIDRVRKETII